MATWDTTPVYSWTASGVSYVTNGAAGSTGTTYRYGSSHPGNRMAIPGLIDVAGNNATSQNGLTDGYSGNQYMKKTSGVNAAISGDGFTGVGQFANPVDFFLGSSFVLAEKGYAAGTIAVAVSIDETLNPSYVFGKINGNSATTGGAFTTPTQIGSGQKVFYFIPATGSTAAPAANRCMVLSPGTANAEGIKITSATLAGGVYTITAVANLTYTHSSSSVIDYACHYHSSAPVVLAEDGAGSENVGVFGKYDCYTPSSSGQTLTPREYLNMYFAAGPPSSHGSGNGATTNNLSAAVAGSMAAPGRDISRGMVMLTTAVDSGSPTGSTITLTTSVYYLYGPGRTGSDSNTWTGNPNSPGTALQTVTYTLTPSAAVVAAGMWGYTGWGGAVVGLQGYLGGITFKAQWATPLSASVGTQQTINLTGYGTSWTTSAPTFTIWQPYSSNGTIKTAGGMSGLGDGASIVSTTVNSNTSATLVVNTGNTMGKLTISDGTNISSVWICPASEVDVGVVMNSFGNVSNGPTIGVSAEQFLTSACRKAMYDRVAPPRQFRPFYSGVPGETTVNWYQALATANGNTGPGVTPLYDTTLCVTYLKQGQPGIVLVQTGQNDSESVSSWNTNMTGIITQLKLLISGVKIVLLPLVPRPIDLTPTGLVASNTFAQSCNALLPSLADNVSVFFTKGPALNFYSAGVGNVAWWSSDYIHGWELFAAPYGQSIADAIRAVTDPQIYNPATPPSGFFTHGG